MYAILLVIILLLLFCYCKCLGKKEGYRRQKRQGIRMPWRRAGGAGRTLAMKGTRYPQLPNPNVFYNYKEDLETTNI